MGFLRQLFRPEYEGGGRVVSPERWWSPRSRRTARLVAKLCAYFEEDMDAQRQNDLLMLADMLVFGDTYFWRP